MLKHTVQHILKKITKRIIKKYHPDIVGVTGSVGKTSTKDIAVQLLSHKFRVRGNVGSFNNEFGLPLTVIGVDQPTSKFGWIAVVCSGLKLVFKRNHQYPEVLVLEMGADRPGDISYLTRIAPCCVGVVTAIAPAHLEFFKTLQKIIMEKRVMVSHLDKNGYAILNRDDAEVYAMREKTDADVISFGFNPDATVIASGVSLDIDQQTNWPKGMRFKVSHDGSMVPVHVKGVVGEHVVYPVLGAVSIALALGMNLVEISNALSEIETTPGRARLIDGIKGTQLIDDTYNASPAAMRKAIEALVTVSPQASGKRIAVLGDMLELGSKTTDTHREVGLRIAEYDIDLFITVGEAMKIAAQTAKEAGMDENKIVSFATSAEAGKFLQTKMQTGDVVLIKGSRSMHMEVVTREVMAEPLDADRLLVH